MAGTTLLVVDDDVDCYRNLSDILGDVGHQFDVAHVGPTSLAVAHRTPYQLALLDLRLPCRGGVALFREMRKICPRMDGVLITGFANEAAVRDARVAGMLAPSPSRSTSPNSSKNWNKLALESQAHNHSPPNPPQPRNPQARPDRLVRGAIRAVYQRRPRVPDRHSDRIFGLVSLTAGSSTAVVAALRFPH